MRTKHRRLIPTIILAALIAGPLLACQVPVFRYALERWQSDQFELVVIHDGELTTTATERIQQLQESDYESILAANFNVKTVQADKLKDRRLLQSWKKRSNKEEPMLVAMYPSAAKEVPDRICWSGSLLNDSVNHIPDSPVRQQITKILVEGASAVWIFVPSGNKEQDAAALKTLKEEVQQNEKTLELPVQDEIESEDDLIQVSGLELKIAFSIVTVRRDDPKERFLLSMLLNSESDLADLNEPMAFPTIGRGRVLYGLIGKGINSQTIGAACRFLVGPCSCQVKNQNPGFDLLLAKDWDMKLFGKKATPQSAESAKDAAPVLLAIPPGKKK